MTADELIAKTNPANPFRARYRVEIEEFKEGLIHVVARVGQERQLSFPFYLEYLHEDTDHEVDVDRIFEVMTPPVAPIHSTVNKALGRFVGRGGLVDPRPWYSLFNFADKNRMQVKEIDLESEVITLGPRRT